jgi:SAM-dependent methyltransferase
MSDLHRDWDTLEQLYSRHMRGLIASRISLGEEHREQTLRFALGRLREGREIAQFFLARSSAPQTVLDLGAGDGGTSIGIANFRPFAVIASDLQPDRKLNRLREAVPFRVIAANGHRLPLASESVDIVICLDVIEHVPQPERLGAEIMRVLKRGGRCMLTTPARLRHLVGRDPHFGIRGLMMLPDGLQRRAVLNIARRRLGDVDPSLYDVRHIYWTAAGILRCFSEPKRAEVLWDSPPRGWRALFRNLLWNRIVIEKAT